MKIRFCEHNKGKGQVYRRLQEEFPGIDVKINKCIKQCSVCREIPMATADRVRITGKDADQLFERLAEIITSAVITTPQDR